MALLRRGYRVEYEDLALAYTEAPTNANGLMRQRFRWSFGILQAVYKHRAVFARKGVLGWIALPNILIFQILLPLVSPFIDMMFVVGVGWYFVQKYFHPESTDPASFQKLVVFFVAFLVIDFIASAIAFALERRQSGNERRRLAAEPGLAAAFRVPAAVFNRAVQDAEAGRRRPKVCLGQAGTHCRGEGPSGAPRVGKSPVVLASSMEGRASRPSWRAGTSASPPPSAGILRQSEQTSRLLP